MSGKRWRRGRVAGFSIFLFAGAAQAQLSADAPGIKSDREMRSEHQKTGSSTEETARRLEDPQPEVRLGAVKALAESNSPRAQEYLIQAVGDSDLRVAAAAVDALGRVGTKDASTFLTQRLFLAATSPGLRQRILVTLGRIHDPASAGPILEFMQGETDPKIRGTAIHVIGEIGDDSTLGELRSFGEREQDAQMKALLQDAAARIEVRQPHPGSAAH